MAKMLYNYDLGTFEELTKRLTFPVLHITSSQFNRNWFIWKKKYIKKFKKKKIKIFFILVEDLSSD